MLFEDAARGGHVPRQIEVLGHAPNADAGKIITIINLQASNFSKRPSRMAAANHGDGGESDAEHGIVWDERIIIEQGLVGGSTWRSNYFGSPFINLADARATRQKYLEIQ